MNSIPIFISYAREDYAKARKLYEDLKRSGMDPWLDEESLLPGRKWKLAIQNAIKKSKFFLALLSSNMSNKERGYVYKEIREALDILDEIPDSKIFIIPVRLDECEIVLEKLSELHRVDMFPQWDRGLRKICQTVESDIVPQGFSRRHTLRGHNASINRIAWSPNGEMIASPSNDETVRLWDLQQGKLIYTFKNNSRWVTSLAWSPDNQKLAYGLENGKIQICQSNPWRKINELFDHTMRVECLAWSPDGLSLASASGDYSVKIWATNNWDVLHTISAHQSWVNSVAWSPSGKYLATGAEDNTIKIWDNKGVALRHTLQGHSDWIVDINCHLMKN